MLDRVVRNYCLVGAAYGFCRKTIDVVLNKPEVTVERS